MLLTLHTARSRTAHSVIAGVTGAVMLATQVRQVFSMRSRLGLAGNTLNVDGPAWERQDSGTGAGIDSYYEYLLKVRTPRNAGALCRHHARADDNWSTLHAHASCTCYADQGCDVGATKPSVGLALPRIYCRPAAIVVACATSSFRRAVIPDVWRRGLPGHVRGVVC